MIFSRANLRAAVVFTSAAALLSLAACQKSEGPNFKHNKTGTGTPVAKFGGDSITIEELQERFAEMSPFARARFQTVDERKTFVEGMARFELLAAEAIKRGMHNDPEVVETAKKVMVQKFVQQEMKELSKEIPPEDVAAYYEKHKSDYVKPQMTRLTHIFLAAPENDPKRSEQQQKAEALLKEASALQSQDFSAFSAMVAQHSEDPRTKPLRGDMRYLSYDEMTSEYGAEVASAAKNLTRVGDLSGVVATPNGFHILKLQGRQEALDLKLDQVSMQIKSRLEFERRQETFNTFMDGLKKNANYSLDEKALAGIEIDMKAPAKETKGPPPGFIHPVAGPPVQ